MKEGGEKKKEGQGRWKTLMGMFMSKTCGALGRTMLNRSFTARTHTNKYNLKPNKNKRLTVTVSVCFLLCGLLGLLDGCLSHEPF